MSPITGTINLPNIKTIGNEAFKATNITRVIIGPDCTNMNQGVFQGCSQLTSIICKATTPPTLTYNNTFTGSICPIYVPAASIDTYKSAQYWSAVSNRIQAISNS